MSNSFKVKNGLIVEGNSVMKGSSYGTPALSVEGTIYVHDFVDNTSTIMTAGGPLFKYDGPMGYLRIGSSVREDYINDYTKLGYGNMYWVYLSNDKVGIVNTGPQYLLDVYLPGTDSDWFNGVRAPHISTEGSFNNVADIFAGASIKSKIGFPQSEVPYANTDIAFYTTNTLLNLFPYHADMTSEKMRVTYEGRVLIGTSTPDFTNAFFPANNKLEINGDAFTYGIHQMDSLVIAQASNSYGIGNIFFGDPVNNITIQGGAGIGGINFNLYNNQTLSLIDYTAGTVPGSQKVIVGNGFSGPSKLSIWGDAWANGGFKSAAFYITDFTGYTNQFSLTEAGGSLFVYNEQALSTALVIDPANYVGINTTSPQKHLDVRGDMSFGDGTSGTIYEPNGKLLISYTPDSAISGGTILNINPTAGGYGPSVVTIGYGLPNSGGYGLEVGVNTSFHAPVDCEQSINAFNSDINVYNGTVKIDDVDIKSLMIAYSIALS